MNTKYSISLDKIMEWVSKNPSNEKMVQTTITQILNENNDKILEYDDDMNTKEISETKSSLNENMSSIRFSFVQMLLNEVFINKHEDILNTTTFGGNLCFNTLKNYGFIIEKK